MVQLEKERAERVRGQQAITDFLLTEDDVRDIWKPKVPLRHKGMYENSPKKVMMMIVAT
jgi:hypothetical protein